MLRGLRYYTWLSMQLAQRDIQGRYRGMSLSWLWAVLTPLLMLGVYTLAFKYIFKVRWPGAADHPIDFSLRLFAGLLIFLAAAECWSRSPRLIVDQPHLVKKVKFPLALLPAANVISGLFHAGMSMVLLMIVSLVLGAKPGLAWLTLPLLLLPLGMLLWGLGLLLATLGVFVRDLQQAVGLVIGLLQFLTPVFYPLAALPEAAQTVINWNPLTVYIEHIRAVLFGGAIPGLHAWLQSAGVSTLFLGLSFALYRRVRTGFADVL